MKQAQVQAWLRSKKVAVLMGGWSRERPISLKTGKAVLDSFHRLGIRAIPIDVQPNFQSVLKKKKIKFAFIALHGTFGEDGQVQSALDQMRIQFTGSNAFSSSIAMNKQSSKVLFNLAGVPSPPGLVLTKNEYRSNPRLATKPIRSLLAKGPVFVKPVDQGSAIGISRVSSPRKLPAALKSCFRVSEEALIEKFVGGRELTVGILGDKTLPVIEIVPEHAFYDFHSKYAKGGSRHILPARISSSLAKKIQRLSLKAFQTLTCSVYGRVDVILSRSGKPYVLEVNTIPGMTNTSLLPEAAKAVGLSFDDLVLKIVSLSLMERS